jgi:hypothetical protein
MHYYTFLFCSQHSSPTQPTKPPPPLFVKQYIRARKWVIDDAIKMVLNALKWRVVEQLDELVELSDTELDAKYPKFIEQLKSGKGFLRGADPLGRPVSIINTRLHHKGDQPPETIHRYTLYVKAPGFSFSTPFFMYLLIFY